MRSFVACAVALLTASSLAKAGPADTSTDTASSELSEVTVTAERREENLQDVPFSATVLTGEALDVLGNSGQDIRQLAFSVPSLNIESSNGRSFPRFYIRGYGNTDFTNFASQPVSLVYDDIVQENPILKGFPIFDQADVEVLRGPQGTLFGRNSPAGVVKLESAKPVLGELSGSFNISEGTFNTADLQAVANLPINDQLAARISVQGQRRDDWVHNFISGQNLEGYNDWAARAQLLFKPDDSFNALLNFHVHSESSSARLFRANIIQPGTNDLVAGFNSSSVFFDGLNTQNFGSLGANLHLTWTLPAVTLQSITGYESIRHYFTQGDIDGGYGPGFFVNAAAPAGPGPIPFGVETAAGVQNHYQVTQEFRAISNLEGPLQGQAGVFLFYENITAFSNDYDITGATLTDTTVSQQKNNAEAIFGSLEYAVLSALKVRAGVRFTEDHKTFSVPFSDVDPPLPLPQRASASASNVSWDVSPTYQLQPDISLYARIATGFRAPSFGAPEAGPPSIPIQIARSENDISYEAGIKSELFDRRIRLDFDLFYYDVSHQQLTEVGGAANTTQLVNAKDTIGKGGELEFDWKVLPNLSFTLSSSYNQTRIKDPNLAVGFCFSCTVTNPVRSIPTLNGGNPVAFVNGNPLPQAAKWIVDTSLRYDYPLPWGGKAYLFTDWAYRSDINFFLYDSKEFIGAPLTQGGVRLGYQWNNDKYDAAVFCRNCTNEIRIIGGIDFDNLTGFINDPRVFGVQFSAKL